MFLCVRKKKILGDLILICLAKITLPKSVANSLGNVFVPDGKPMFEDVHQAQH